MPSTSLEASTFDFVCNMVRERSGIVLEKGKEYLVEARLLPLIRQEKIGSLQELENRLRSQPFDALHHKVVDAMTTNETLFFRDSKPFDAMRLHILPELLERNRATRTINIWCGACSSGQEPYSLAILLKEFFATHPGWTTRIQASDISPTMVERSSKGCYNQLEVNRGLPASMLVKYFERQGLEWRVKSDVRSMVEFFRMNLVGTWPLLPTMDIIFLRNVLIYFDTAMKKAILNKMRLLLKPQGYLFLGGAETTLYLDSDFDQVYFDKAACYRPKNRAEKTNAKVIA
jgi:chemotaxis protein methyltransferase CheR